VREHLVAEYAYSDAVMARARVTPNTLYGEFRARLPEAEQQVPVASGDYLYYSRFVPDQAHPVHCRRLAPDGPEEILLDENALTAAAIMSSVTVLAVSPNHQLLLFGVDIDGDERCTLFVKDLKTGSLLPDSIPDAASEVAWKDDRTFYYLHLDDANRPFEAHRFQLPVEATVDSTGQNPVAQDLMAQDLMVYEEHDPAFHLSLRRSESGRYLFLLAQSLQCSEAWYLACDAAGTAFAPLFRRVPGVEVFPTHQGDHFYLLTNEDAPNFRLVRTPAGGQPASWESVVPHRPEIRLRHVEAFARHLVIHEREAGVPHLQIIDTTIINNGQDSSHRIAFPEPFYTLHLGDNRQYDSAVLRFGYDSFITPFQVYDYHMDDRILWTRHASMVPGHDPQRYSTVRMNVTTPDGAEIPVSIVHRRDLPRRNSHPLLLYVYGSYGHSIDAEFSAMRLSLLDRGVVFAVAHVRGGGERGPAWHLAGCRRDKPRAIEDLIACAEHLIGLGLTRPDRLGLMGQSAGGLLVTAAMNARPDLFAAVVADVPFVDPIGTLADPEQPYTALDREEWGNPLDPEDFAVLKTYAPYDNVQAADYPNVLLTAGWHDVHVGYWEPAKLAARLRMTTACNSLVLLRPRMFTGHDGSADRYAELREWAFMYAFVLEYLRPEPPDAP
jgi:oligopeptidase B